MVVPLQKISIAPVKPGISQPSLILQDPNAFDLATQPTLRSSNELIVEPISTLEREKAREIWESMSLEPEVAMEKLKERKRLLVRAEKLAQKSTITEAEVIDLQTQLTQAREERLNHPVVYVGAIGLLGMSALWWLERRKRMQLQDGELEIQAQQTPDLMDEVPNADSDESNSSFSIEDTPDLATDFATDVPGFPEHKPYALDIPQVDDIKVQTAEIQPPISAALPAEDIASPSWAQPKHKTLPDLPTEEELAALSWKAKESSLLGMSKRVLGNILRRRSDKEAAAHSHLSSQSEHATITLSDEELGLIHAGDQDDATQMLHDEEAQLAFEQELLVQRLSSSVAGGYDPDQANIDLLTHTRIVPQSGEKAMEHLLELRTAVSGLCALGRLEGAARLLEQHVSADPSTCAWAYLEYMQICEQIELREDFESMRKRYRLQFSRMSPYWHEPNSNVLGLDGYARATGELCNAWSQGREQAYSTLSSWLIGPLLGRKLVQLPAYHDLLDLYELLEFLDLQDANPVVDDASAILQVPALPAAAQTTHDFVPTVSLLDLDYEFSSDVTLEERDVALAEKAVTIVKTGNFKVDFNLAGEELDSSTSVPVKFDKK